MIALRLPDVKKFMSCLLLSDTFDHFLFLEGEIVTFASFSMDGFLRKEFFSPEEESPDGSRQETYAYWKQMKEFCLSLIRGKRPPLSFKFVFSLSPANTAELIQRNSLGFQPSDVQGLYLNIRFDGASLHCVTGTSLHVFTLDKSLEQAWDSMVQRFLSQKGIDFEPC